MMKSRYIILFFTVGLICGCNQMPDNSQKVSQVVESVDSLNAPVVDQVEEFDSDCIFDTATQTDEFLKGIETFSDYEWNDKEKFAVVKLPNDEYLNISRGGCVHYTFGVELVSSVDTTDFKKSEYWISRLLSYTNLLTDFDNDLIKSLVKTLGEPEIETDQFVFWPFPVEDYCGVEIVIDKRNGPTSISFSYYLC